MGVGCRTTRRGWKDTRGSETYRYKLDNLIPVVDILLDVDCEGRAHQGVQEEVILRAGVISRRGHIWRMGGMLGVVAPSAVGGRACWCHGSCPRSSWAAMLQGASALVPLSMRTLNSVLNASHPANHRPPHQHLPRPPPHPPSSPQTFLGLSVSLQWLSTKPSAYLRTL